MGAIPNSVRSAETTVFEWNTTVLAITTSAPVSSSDVDTPKTGLSRRVYRTPALAQRQRNSIRFMESFEDLHAFAAALEVAKPLSDGELAELLNAIATVHAPRVSAHVELITLSSMGKAKSRKSGNIVLNWGRFFDLVPDAGVATAGAAGQRGFVRTLIALYVWNKVWRGMEVELSDAEASTIEAIWSNGARTRRLPSDDAFALTNDLLLARSTAALSRRDFEIALTVLSRMACIDIEDDHVWLREWVRKRT